MFQYAGRLGAMKILPKAVVDVDRIKRELVLKNGSWFKHKEITGETPPASVPQFFTCYEETATEIAVPRHYEVPWLRKPIPLLVSKKFGGGHTGLLEGFKPRPRQPPAIAALAEPGDKILAMSCGSGKTVMSIAAWAAHRKGPLLVLVDTDELAKQWKQAALLVCGLADNDVGTLQGTVEDWQGKAMVIGMIQTMWRREYPKALYEYFEVVCYDEVHVCGASKMQLVLPKFSGERWGLSATPERPDGNTKLIKLHMGEVAYEDLEQDLKPDVFFVQTKYKAPHWIERGRFAHKKAMIASKLAKSEPRNREILDYIDRAASQGRCVIVMGDRIEQLQWLMNYSTYKEESGLLVAAISVGKDGKGKDKKKPLTEEQRESALKKRIVYATSALARKGLDKPELDTLILPVPVGDEGTVQQMFGRIQRITQEGKRAVVVVFEDKANSFIKAADSIRAYCKKNGIRWKIIGEKNELAEKKSAQTRFHTFKRRR